MKACAEDDSWEAAIGRMLTDSRALLLCMTGLDVLVLGVGVSVHVSADGGGAELGCMHSRRNAKNKKMRKRTSRVAKNAWECLKNDLSIKFGTVSDSTIIMARPGGEF